MEKKLRLEDVVDFALLQRLQDSFAAVAQITTVVIGPEGQQLTRPSNLYGFCQMMQQDPEGVKKCLVTNGLLCEKNCQSGGPEVMVCPHSGLTTAAVPIFQQGQHLGSWIIGQARVGGAIPEVLCQTAEELDMDYTLLEETIQALPLMTQEEFRCIYEFLQALSETIIQLGEAGRKMALSNKELQQVTAQYERTARMLRKFVDSTDIAMYVADYHTGEMLMANRRFAEGLGMDADDMLGHKCWEFSAAAGQKTFCEFCPREQLLDETGEPAGPYCWEQFHPELKLWMRLNHQAIHWVDGRLAQLVTIVDITAERTLRDELSRLAYYDRQMDLPNALRLQKDIAQQTALRGAWLVCYDIQKLRRVNDAYGRHAGDVLMQAVAEWVRAQPFGEYEMYRIEGDEFCLYYRRTSQAAARRVAAAIQARFATAWLLQVEGEEVPVQCEVSVAVVPVAAAAQENVVSQVERVLDASRQSGTVAVYNKKMDEDARHRVQMELALRQCIKADMQGFDVHFQPIIDPAAGTWKALEALCRWQAPGIGTVEPPVFIRMAEQLGLIRTLGMWVLQRAVAACKQWGLDQLEGFFLSVNLSPDQVTEPGIAQRILDVLEQHDFPPQNLFLEVTESTQFTFSRHNMGVIRQLRAAGVRFSLDDFGTGYSSFNNLKNLPVSIIKTERAFIANIECDDYLQYLFYTMTELVHAADMKLIAEGVETRQQLEIVMRNRVDYLQGFHFSQPLTAAQLGEKLDRFVQVDASFYQLDATAHRGRPGGKEGFMVSPALFRLLNDSMQVLLDEEDMDTAFGRVLALVGGHLGVSRAYLFLRGQDARFTNTHEWCTQDIASQKDFLANVDMAQLAPSWLPALERDGMIVTSDIATLPPDLYEMASAQDVKAMLALPLLEEAEIIGFVGLDDVRFRTWLPEVVELVQNLCRVMASGLKKQRLKQQAKQSDLRFVEVLNHVELALMVTDPDTDKILWANQAFRQQNQLGEDCEGQYCYAAIYARSQRCENCKVGLLEEEGPAQACSWESYNEKTGRYYLVNDSLVDWEGGKKAHLQYSIDITEAKQVQQQLQQAASTDSLTGTYNRASLMAALAQRLRQAQEDDKPLSIIFVDIDRLKYANDTFGHDFGDELILSTVKALRGHIRAADCIGRMGGDEFIVLMDGCRAAQAKERIERARDALGRVMMGPVSESFTFSYGVVESGELPWDGSERVLNALVNLADDRMRDYKKTQRVMRESYAEDSPF
ncbi:EAL domain-containing protein [Ruminococcaceae bacterium OttesenSCG-928-O06]|nr:EAL domain-containing protein [Ruminococcaceae bacterium OttesenSCG-928-O06]